MFQKIEAMLLCGIALFLQSCSSDHCLWRFNTIETQSSCGNSCRLVLPTDFSSPPLEIELTKSAVGIKVYLNLLQFSAKPYLDIVPPCALVEISTETENFSIFPLILRGEQRLLLQESDAQLLIRLLSEEVPFSIRIGRFHRFIGANQFIDLYATFLAFPVTP